MRLQLPRNTLNSYRKKYDIDTYENMNCML